MLDVHPPEHAPHGIRDFLLHLLTITVGLLIALGLENAVEALHHRHLVHEADTNLRREMDDNRKDVRDMLGAVASEQARYKELAVFLRARRAGQKTDLKAIAIGLRLATPQDASWQTANATGALGYMEYAHVQRYAQVYQLQHQMDSVQAEALPLVVTLMGMLTGGDPNGMQAADAADALKSQQDVVAYLETMREVGASLVAQYDEAIAAKE